MRRKIQRINIMTETQSIWFRPWKVLIDTWFPLSIRRLNRILRSFKRHREREERRCIFLSHSHLRSCGSLRSKSKRTPHSFWIHDARDGHDEEDRQANWECQDFLQTWKVQKVLWYYDGDRRVLDSFKLCSTGLNELLEKMHGDVYLEFGAKWRYGHSSSYKTRHW